MSTLEWPSGRRVPVAHTAENLHLDDPLVIGADHRWTLYGWVEGCAYAHAVTSGTGPEEAERLAGVGEWLASAGALQRFEVRLRYDDEDRAFYPTVSQCFESPYESVLGDAEAYERCGRGRHAHCFFEQHAMPCDGVDEHRDRWLATVLEAAARRLGIGAHPLELLILDDDPAAWRTDAATVIEELSERAGFYAAA